MIRIIWISKDCPSGSIRIGPERGTFAASRLGSATLWARHFGCKHTGLVVHASAIWAAPVACASRSLHGPAFRALVMFSEDHVLMVEAIPVWALPISAWSSSSSSSHHHWHSSIHHRHPPLAAECSKLRTLTTTFDSLWPHGSTLGASHLAGEHCVFGVDACLIWAIPITRSLGIPCSGARWACHMLPENHLCVVHATLIGALPILTLRRHCMTGRTTFRASLPLAKHHLLMVLAFSVRALPVWNSITSISLVEFLQFVSTAFGTIFLGAENQS